MPQSIIKLKDGMITKIQADTFMEEYHKACRLRLDIEWLSFFAAGINQNLPVGVAAIEASYEWDL
jgi:hypothetical protein